MNGALSLLAAHNSGLGAINCHRLDGEARATARESENRRAFARSELKLLKGEAAEGWVALR